MCDPNLIEAVRTIGDGLGRIAQAIGGIVVVLWLFLIFKDMAGQK